MKRLLQFLIIVLLTNLPDIEGAIGQSYPSRPITLIVPFAAGGGTDIIARIAAEKMSRMLGQQIVVENRPGAAGTIAMRQVAKSVPDGYTLGQGNPSTLAMAPSIYPNLGYDPRKDFAPVGLIGTTPLVLVVHPLVPDSTLEEGPRSIDFWLRRNRWRHSFSGRAFRKHGRYQDQPRSIQRNSAGHQRSVGRSPGDGF
jgi:tripartite-type tricarboxylate transporter receptor subunit TctC